MSTTIRAVYEDGVFKPKGAVSLEEHVEVEIVIPSPPGAQPIVDPDDPTGWKAIDRLIGAGKAITPDGAARHDDYLYGDPRD